MRSALDRKIERMIIRSAVSAFIRKSMFANLLSYTNQSCHDSCPLKKTRSVTLCFDVTRVLHYRASYMSPFFDLPELRQVSRYNCMTGVKVRTGLVSAAQLARVC